MRFSKYGLCVLAQIAGQVFSTRSARRALAIGLAVTVASPLFGEQDLGQLSLEQLMNVQVTSVTKKKQKLSRTGAATYVITQEDIRRSGMNNLPDILRMAPGVNVARIDANAWAISIRGFNFRYSSNVLVLIDGRTVYTPLFSGVLWDQQGLVLEDIDRIEVIRGPGGTVWGANAVNGVINIITKSSADTQGGLLSMGTGSEESARGAIRYGGKIGQRGTYRTYGRYYKAQTGQISNGANANDAWHSSQGGFRADLNLGRRDSMMLQGSLFGTSEGQTITSPRLNQLPQLHTFHDKVAVGSGFLLGRWTRSFANGSEASLQMYYDRYRRQDQALNIQHMGDLDFQYHFQIGSRNDLVAGGGYRLTDMDYRDGFAIEFGNGHRRDNLFNTFVQDEIKLSDSVALVVGSKFEHNAYTGFEFEPSAQIVWSPDDRQAFWASASRAIQQPSWFYAESRLYPATIPLNGGGFGLIQISGSRQIQAASLLDYEAGYRKQLSKRVSVDVAAFLSRYRRLQTAEPREPYFTLTPRPPHLVIPSVYENLGGARNYGFEVIGNWQVTNRWRLSPGFGVLRMKMIQDPASKDPTFLLTSGNSPQHQATLRSLFNLTRNVEWDTSLYFVGNLNMGPVPSYTRLDTRLGWRVNETVELSVGGQNLLSPRRFEFLNALQVNPTQVERSVVGQVTWRF